MANKMPFMQFYPIDWSIDTRILSLSARGAWLELIMAMHVRGRISSISGTLQRLAGLVGCSEKEMASVLKELKENNVADIVTEMKRDCNGDVTEKFGDCSDNVTEVITITCRRLQRAENERDTIKERVQKHRAGIDCNDNVTEMKRGCNGDVTEFSGGCNGNVTPENTEYRKENPLTGVKEKPRTFEKNSVTTPLQTDYPKSVDEVMTLAKTTMCGLPCTRDQADAYFTDRMRKDWTINGQRNRMPVGAVALDLKAWLMRDREKAKAAQNTRTKGEFQDGKHMPDRSDYAADDDHYF